MLLKLGVDISKLEYHCRKALGVVEKVWGSQGFAEPVITSTYEGNHSPGSLHYQNRAFDVRLPGIGNLNVTAVRILKEELGKDFDVVLEGDHIHIEYDPK
jgi:hypothetical protein